MTEPQITISDGPDKESEAAILSALKAYNVERFGPSDWRELVISLRNAEGIVTGGLSGHTARGWLYTSLLFIPEEMRGQGLGPKLLAMAEDEARKRGCRGAYIDTMNPDALAIYQACGYEIFGQIEGFTETTALTYLKKPLA
ncbi:MULTISPECIES: GNAT family N-acetyltransferase [unclassified Rhizobium]|uniref:GNAT family N-acetyltransferase n=1 Tax=unclassified Rhizobium TaxID=2613769 RepID=UPI00177B722C|nr:MULTISPECIES: GNAT family N-acetyltransferase [unclassified Rhizobium]MBD8686808.1 GNAT family N-acetyltransferase [Rhizobium sp. CFBP 13644]MBD8691389.1 GNAT family N-acetyltransferase [Rhizobium sp. CFBP 13717]